VRCRQPKQAQHGSPALSGAGNSLLEWGPNAGEAAGSSRTPGTTGELGRDGGALRKRWLARRTGCQRSACLLHSRACPPKPTPRGDGRCVRVACVGLVDAGLAGYADWGAHTRRRDRRACTHLFPHQLRRDHQPTGAVMVAGHVAIIVEGWWSVASKHGNGSLATPVARNHLATHNTRTHARLPRTHDLSRLKKAGAQTSTDLSQCGGHKCSPSCRRTPSLCEASPPCGGGGGRGDREQRSAASSHSILSAPTSTPTRPWRGAVTTWPLRAAAAAAAAAAVAAAAAPSPSSPPAAAAVTATRGS
jgi:hypothetical protein